MNLEPDPVRQSLRALVRNRLRAVPPQEEATWAALCGFGAATLDAPAEVGTDLSYMDTYSAS